jgi:hypothetical protein
MIVRDAEDQRLLAVEQAHRTLRRVSRDYHRADVETDR